MDNKVPLRPRADTSSSSSSSKKSDDDSDNDTAAKKNASSSAKKKKVQETAQVLPLEDFADEIDGPRVVWSAQESFQQAINSKVSSFRRKDVATSEYVFRTTDLKDLCAQVSTDPKVMNLPIEKVCQAALIGYNTLMDFHREIDGWVGPVDIASARTKMAGLMESFDTSLVSVDGYISAVEAKVKAASASTKDAEKSCKKRFKGLKERLFNMFLREGVPSRLGKVNLPLSIHLLLTT